MQKTSDGLLSDLVSLYKKDADSFRILIFTHRQADPDALCSAYAISETFKKSMADSNTKCRLSSRIIAPQGANLVGSALCARLGIDFVDSVKSDEISGADCIVVVDVGEPKLLAPYAEQISSSPARKFLIDHHSSNKRSDEPVWAGFAITIDQNATSTCEIVTQELPVSYLSQTVSKALLAGLLFDSQHLGIATEKTLLATLKLVRAGARMDEAKELLRNKPERSEIIARIKSAQRLKFDEMGKFFVIQSEVSSFQAAVARMLVDIGGDVGIAFGDHEGEARISIRSTQQFFRETRIDLGELLSSFANTPGLTGGGHSTAASVSGTGKAGELACLIVAKLKASLPH